MAYSLNTGHALYPNLIELIGVDAGALVSLKTARTFTPDAGSAFGSGTWGAHFATAGGGFTRKGAAFTDLVIDTVTNPNLTLVAVLNAVSTTGGGGKMQLVSSTASSAPSFGFVAGPKVTSLENYSTIAVTGTSNLTGANMLTLTRTGETSHIAYINSASEFSGAKVGFASSTTTYNSIGGVSGQGSVAANIVWLAWFDKVLTPTEVSDLYASLGASNAFGLVTASGGGATGTLTATESSTDTSAFSGSLLAQGAIAATEAASDTAAFAGTALAQGTLASTETGTDTAAFTGSAIAAGTGSLAATESGADAAAFTGTLLSQGSIAATESAVDTAAFSGSALVQGALAAVETGSDTAAFFSAEQISTRFGISYEGYTAKRPSHRTRSVIKKKVIQAAAKVAALAETVDNYEQHKTRYRGLMLEELSQPVWTAEFERIIQIQLELQEEEDLIALLI